MTLYHTARYTDALRAGGISSSDRDRFSLETLLAAERMDDLLAQTQSARFPGPADVVEELRRQWVEWPPLLSITFPHLREWDERIIRLAEGCEINGLEPPIAPGSWVLVEDPPGSPDLNRERSVSGWSRPLYTIRQGVKQVLGYLVRDGNQCALLSATGGEAAIVLGADDSASLRRVAGVAIPV